MELYQIADIGENLNHAGTKATADIVRIAENLGFTTLKVRMCTEKSGVLPKIKRQIGWWKDWKKVYHKIPKNATVLLQHPFHYPEITRNSTLYRLKREKKVRFICLIHDVEKLRGFRYNTYYEKEFRMMLQLYDVLIVHNEAMKAYFEGLGVPEDRLVSLEIFDYLSEGENQTPVFERSMTVAGNLDTEKCGYIRELSKFSEILIHLYGPNFNPEMEQYQGIQYHGQLSSDEIPKALTRGFGLVWDGKSVSGLVGESGQYLTYNNPHKLSLFLSSGLPVVISKEAAESNFVLENQVGIVCNNLEEGVTQIQGLTEETYQKYVENVKRIAPRLKHGDYGEKALKKALDRLDEYKE